MSTYARPGGRPERETRTTAVPVRDRPASPGVVSATHLLTLQRSAGNRATVAHVERQRRHALTVQRSATGDSDPTLKRIYDAEVAASAVWAALDQQVQQVTGRRIRLMPYDHAEDQHSRGEYDSRTNTVYLSYQNMLSAPTLPEAQRSALLMELHNVLSQQHFTEIGQNYEAPAIAVERGQGPARLPASHYRAALALSTEWLEWIGTAETSLRVQAIAHQQPAGQAGAQAGQPGPAGQAGQAGQPGAQTGQPTGPPPLRPGAAPVDLYGALYRQPGRGWCFFRNYLEHQIRDRHTQEAYDRRAGDRFWVGWPLLESAVVRAGGMFEITQIEMATFAANVAAGVPARIKDRDRNPFRDPAVVFGPLRVLNLNTATREQFERLPGIGPGRAARILAARAVRPFTGLDDLASVSGFGPRIVSDLAAHVTV